MPTCLPVLNSAIEIHHAIGHLDWRQELVAQAEVEREAARHPPVIRYVAAHFNYAVAHPSESADRRTHRAATSCCFQRNQLVLNVMHLHQTWTPWGVLK